MRTEPEPSAGDDAVRIDALRHRLYRADASEEDVRRYLAAQPEPVAPAEDLPGQPLATMSGVRRRALLGVMAGAAALAAVAALISTDRGAPAVTASSPAPAADVRDIGEGRTLAVEEGTVSAPVRAATSVHGVAAVGLRYEGRGNAVVAFDPPTGAIDGGRMKVALSTSGTAPVAWRALLIVLRGDGRSYPAVLARGRTGEPRGTADPTTFIYPTGPPSRIAVEAPAGSAWSLLVAVTDGIEPTLR